MHFQIMNCNIENNISVKENNNVIVFENITKEGYDIRLNIAPPSKNATTRIFVMKNGNIIKYFLIYRNKLLKVDDRFIIENKRIHYNNNLYFHTNEYILESCFGDYLNIIHNKLSELNSKLSGLL